jgi:RNA polymerase sigma-70 factor (ECF subfamily)
VLRALELLPPDTAIVLALFYGEGLTTAEMADALEVTVTAVTSRLSRARARLREHIDELEADPRVRASLLADVDGWTQSLFGPGLAVGSASPAGS